MNIDWSRAPKKARYWAMDRNGEAHWFFLMPSAAPFTDFWWPDEPEPAPSFGFSGDWKKSLVERPVTPSKR